MRPPGTSDRLQLHRPLSGVVFSSLLLVAGVGAGCVAADLDPAGQLAQPIIGGVVNPGDPAVVMVMAEDGRGGMSLCTGEVISPHVVLTAAHCVDPASVGQGISFRVFLGADYNDARQSGNAANYAAVKSVAWDPKFNVNRLELGHDIAVVVLRAPLNVAPLPYARAPLANNDRGATLRLVGYGVTSGRDVQGLSAGTKRQVKTTLTAFDNLLVQLGDANHNTCEGDSGGPALLSRGGVETIIGVTSYGDQGCVMGGFDTRVDTYSAWIDGYVMANDPQFLPGPGVDLGGGGPDLGAAPADLSSPPRLDLASPPRADLATGGARDLAAGRAPDLRAAVAPGEVGATCHAHADCASSVCAFINPDEGYCTARCDTTSACPSGLVCGLIDGVGYCVLPVAGGGASGCSVALPRRSAAAPTLGLGGLILLAGALLRRKASPR